MTSAFPVDAICVAEYNMYGSEIQNGGLAHAHWKYSQKLLNWQYYLISHSLCTKNRSLAQSSGEGEVNLMKIAGVRRV